MRKLAKGVGRVKWMKGEVEQFTTFIFGKRPGGSPEFAGCGTFVRVGSRDCLLTAGHVWEKVVAQYQEFSVTSGAGRPTELVIVPRWYGIYASKQPRKGWDRWGPDIALAVLPKGVARNLEAADKSFYNLTTRRKVAVTTTVKRSGTWLLLAAPGDGVAQVGKHSRTGRDVIQVEAYALAARKDGKKRLGITTRRGIDYAGLPLPAKSTKGFPKSYKGFSGAGLWRADLEGTERPTLEGVAFFWEPAKRRIRCHGRRTIYRHLLARC